MESIMAAALLEKKSQRAPTTSIISLLGSLFFGEDVGSRQSNNMAAAANPGAVCKRGRKDFHNI